VADRNRVDMLGDVAEDESLAFRVRQDHCRSLTKLLTAMAPHSRGRGLVHQLVDVRLGQPLDGLVAVTLDQRRKIVSQLRPGGGPLLVGGPQHGLADLTYRDGPSRRERAVYDSAGNLSQRVHVPRARWRVPA
jgi:hypothetical protein